MNSTTFNPDRFYSKKNTIEREHMMRMSPHRFTDVSSRAQTGLGFEPIVPIISFDEFSCSSDRDELIHRAAGTQVETTQSHIASILTNQNPLQNTSRSRKLTKTTTE